MAKSLHPDSLAPRENPQLIGHAAAVAKFHDEMARGRLPHAYLITGPKGIGKATFAFHMARHVLAQGAQRAAAPQATASLFGDALEPAAVTGPPSEGSWNDPNDPLFRRVATGSHTDLLALAPAYDAKKHTEKAQISAEEARHVPEFLSYTAAEGNWRVVIVDAVDQLHPSAANALLKIVEEPPANALLLLVCHQPGAILPTIRSRCRLFAMHPPTRDAFDTILATVAPQIALHDYAALHALAEGSPGLAITLAKHDGLAHYAGWLAALQPNAANGAQQEWADRAASIKSPEAWAMQLHAWRVAMQRIVLHPPPIAAPIVARETMLIAAIAEANPFPLRQAWLASAQQLLALTETFHLDKRATLRLMLDPARLIQQFPAAA